MNIQIPKKFMGIDGEEALERVRQKTPVVVQSRTQGQLFPSDIKLSDYLQIPGHNIVIAKTESLKGLDFYDTLEQLKTARFRMPKIKQFVDHYINVRDCAEGKRSLLDGAGQLLSQNDAKDLWNYLSSGHRRGCYTWLDAIFQSGSDGKLEMITDLTVQNKGQNRTLAGQRIKLDNYLYEDAYVDLSFNPQGLPTTKFVKQEYKQGNNIYFYHPRENVVARFYANSGRACLYCDGDPSNRNSFLGVFACAEGTAPSKKSGGNT